MDHRSRKECHFDNDMRKEELFSLGEIPMNSFNRLVLGFQE